jgi:8-oxo-dGTP diphosphatase
MTQEENAIPEFGNKLEGINYIDRPGAYAVIQNNEKQIAVIQTGNGCFLPGGGLDPGETEVDALHRELMEETGFQISVTAEIGSAVEYIKASSENKYYRIQSRFYQAQLDVKVGEGIEQDHHLIWLSQEEALSRLTRQSQAWAVQNGVAIQNGSTNIDGNQPRPSSSGEMY